MLLFTGPCEKRDGNLTERKRVVPEKRSKLEDLAAKVETECRRLKVSAGLLCDTQIAYRVETKGMIEPFQRDSIRLHGVSAGLTHHGYDARLGRRFKTFKRPLKKRRVWCTTTTKLMIEIERECSTVGSDEFTNGQIEWAFKDIIEPGVTELSDDDFVIDDLSDEEAYILWPHTAVLGHTMEYFRIPNDIHCTAVGKSTLARLFIHPLTTPFESGWEGQATLEIVNMGERPVMLRPGMGVIQVEFHAVDPADISYADKGGKYQGQTSVEISRW